MARKKNKVCICEVCNEVVPGFEKWRGRVVLCGKAECLGEAKKVGKGGRHVVEPNTLKCAWPDCNNFVPGGLFIGQARGLTCSEKCYKHSKWKYETLTCANPGCGRTYRGRSREGRLTFCGRKCQHAHYRVQIANRCGIFRPLLEEYMVVARQRVRFLPSVSGGLSVFFQYLTEEGIANLDEVDSQTITNFLEWGEETGRPSVWNAIWPVSSFMKWLIVTGRRKFANPVIPAFHSKKKAQRLPRPYTEEEMARIWELLDKRGSTMVKAAVAIGEESGLRISEIANLRVSDIDLKEQRLFVRLPNKAMTEAYVPFHDKAVKWVRAWLNERDPNLNHDHLFLSGLGGPATKESLHNAIACTLCKTYRGTSGK